MKTTHLNQLLDLSDEEMAAHRVEKLTEGSFLRDEEHRGSGFLTLSPGQGLYPFPIAATSYHKLSCLKIL